MRKGFGFHDRHSPFRFDPATLFIGGAIEGAFYDPSNITTLFQDDAGTTPVTAVEQTVGRILDLSGNANHATQSVLASRPTYRALYNIFTGTAALATQTATTRAAAYTLRFTGAGSIALSGTATGTYTAGTHSVTCTAGALTATVTGTVTNADMRLTIDVANQPSYQDVVTSANYDSSGFRPYLAFDGSDDSMLTNSVDFATVTSDRQARRNLLDNPTQFDVTTSWSVNSLSVTANNTTAPDGTSTAELITLGAGTTRKFILQAASAFSGARTYSFYAKYGTNRFVQFLNNGTAEGFANFDIQNGVIGTTGSGVTSSISDAGNGWWRCVVTHSIAAATEFRIYGVNSNSAGWDSTTTSTETYFLWGAQLETGSIATAFQNIGTDKMTVWAGVTKSSDAAQGVVAELSATIASNNGAFLLSAPNSAAANYNWSSKGTTQVDNTVTTYTAPHTAVLTGQADIAAPSNIIRINGAQAGSVTTTQGTGNFGNYALNVGRRNNATLPFNGRLYSLIVLGAPASDWQIWATEQWMSQKVGI